jgi:hypothetical protein
MAGTRSGPGRRASGRLAVALGALAVAAPAGALVHELLIVEVCHGADAAPDAQYVVLQMYSPGQTQLAGHPMRFYNASGGALGTAEFGAIANGADDARILIATSTAEALFGVEADLRVPVLLRSAGGKVCFDTVDCFAWEGYTPVDPAVGTPYSQVASNRAARRAFTAPLDLFDDTNDSEADFAQTTSPAPRNNAGAVGALDPDALFLAGFEKDDFGGWSAVVD